MPVTRAGLNKAKVEAIIAENTSTVTQSITVGDNSVTHSTGKRARAVTFLVNGAEEEIPWEVDSFDPLNKIIVSSTEAITDVEINIFSF